MSITEQGGRALAELEAAIAADYSNIAGMVVRKDGRLVYENYFGGCTRESRVHVFSVTKSVWAADPNGVNTGGWGLTLSALDLAKIGELIRNGGVYDGARIVTEEWLHRSTAEQSRWGERNLPYGYLWWVLEQERGCAAIGDGGNILYVSPEKNLVAAITSRFQPRVKDRIEFIREYVEPVFA